MMTDYNNKGGITFTIGTIKEGNAVIALKDATGTIMWSWHIWVTAIDFSRDIILTNHATYGSRNFKIMPVNLGWCSGDIPVLYYDRHECEVKITQRLSDGSDGVSQTVKIIQEPHIAVPCGNNPYYQWGRKDPFIAGGNGNETIKQWYDAAGNAHNTLPQMMYTNTDNDNDRVQTMEATASLIQYPDKWQNGPRRERDSNDPLGTKYIPKDNIYFNLWNNKWWSTSDLYKTVYDPCPPGWHVSWLYTFTGFTDSSGSIADGVIQDDKPVDIKERMYAATEGNMMPNGWTNSNNYNNNIVEFYTNKTKLISIGFPANGYRDWADARLLQYGMGEI